MKLKLQFAIEPIRCCRTGLKISLVKKREAINAFESGYVFFIFRNKKMF